MPPRISRSSISAASGNKPGRKKVQKSQKRALNAFTAAQHVVQEKSKVRAHRLGTTEPTEERAKRRRQDVEEDGVGDDDNEEARSSKRARADNDSDRGSDSSGNEWRLGGDIDEESDSSLDSDEAFGESDEERFEGFTFRGSSSAGPQKNRKVKKVRSTTGDEDDSMNLDEAADEQDEDEEDDFGDEGVDLATMLDEPLSDEGGESGSEAESESEDSDARSDTSVSEPESDNIDGSDEVKISQLQDLVASLEPSTDKNAGAGDHDLYETLTPSDHALTSRTKLQISDLLPSITDPTLRKSLKTLASDRPGKPTSGIPGKLAAPLPARAQAKIDRSVAAAAAKQELDKWQDTVIRNRRAEHLSFPLVDPTREGGIVGERTLVGIGADKPANELEGAVRKILEESGLVGEQKDAEEERIQKGEELAMKEVGLEEVLARRAALRRARELLFREEIKAKRVKKIKSRSYRRVHRKEKEREEGRRRELMGEEEGSEGEEKRLRTRALERVGGRHKDSKWAKEARRTGRTVWDDSAREGVFEMAKRNEELRRRIEGKSPDIGSESEESESDEEAGSEEERQKVRRRLDRLDQADEEQVTGLAGMAFMRRADAAQREQNEQTIRDIRRELDGPLDSDGYADEDETVGRRVFGPKPKTGPVKSAEVVKNVLEEPDEDAQLDDEGAEIITEATPDNTSTPKSQKLKPANKGSDRRARNDAKSKTTSENDIDAWISGNTGVKKGKKSEGTQDFIPQPVRSLGAVSTNGSAAPSQVPALKRSSAATLALPETAETGGRETARDKTNSTTERSDESDSDAEAEQNGILSKAEEQEAFHARAFAGDDVDLAFEEEKAGVAGAEDEKEFSSYLPGWGSWTGEGLSKAVRKQNARQRHNPLFKTRVDDGGVRHADRKDAKLKNVIISEAHQRKGKKYLATQLPHGFERKEQYERSLRLPVGPEWTTKETFQRNTKPRVLVKQGIIDPIARPLV